MFAEYQWLNSLGDHRLDFRKLWTATRYVDNRFRASMSGPAFSHNEELTSSNRSLMSLHKMDFYGTTISLEHESGFDLVGVSLWAEGLHIKGIYIVHGFDQLVLHTHQLMLPKEWHWKYRKSSSAGSAKNHAQGFITRAHLALRLSFPIDQARRAIARLVAIALAVGMDPASIRNVLQVLSRRYVRILDRGFKAVLLHALFHRDVWVICQLGA